MSNPKLIPLTQPAALQAEGCPFKTENAARWAFRQRHENGLSGAFVRIGKSIYLDVGRFHELVRKQAA